MTDAVTSPESAAFEQAKRAQAQAAEPGLSAWVEANAGSGKTKVLIDRVARLLLQRPDGRPGAPPDSILCITYTKAAANEMLSRLFSRLGDWSVADDGALRRKLAELEGRSDTDYAPEDLRQARALFARALETPGGLRIETIHAFCARILRRFPLEAGISPGFQEIEEDEANSVWRSVLSERLEAAALSHPDEMRVLARATGGLGVGAALNALQYNRQALQAFWYSLGSEMELYERIRVAAAAGAARPDEILQAAMVDALPEAELSAAIDALNVLEKPGSSDKKLLTALTSLIHTDNAEERYQIYMSALAGAKGDFPAGSNPFTAKAGPLVADLFTRNLKKGDPEGREITRMKRVQAELAAAEVAERTIALMRIGLPMIEAYGQEKRVRAALDFEDLIEHTRALLTRSNAAEWVLYKLDGGLTHLLLDEAQDTSPSQWALINALIQEFQSGIGRDRRADPRTQFVVGDPKQSIYSFQGADQQQFQAEKLTFVAREAIIAEAEDRPVNQPEMAMSFRSTPEVLRFVDEVRARVPLSDAATDPLPPVDADLKPHTARRSNQPGRVELWPLEMPSGPDAEDDAWTTPTDHIPADAPRRRLARSIALEVRQMIDRGESVWQEQPDRSWIRKPVQAEDILILVRSRNELFDALIESLKQEGVAVAGADRLRLLDNIGVQDCLNLIRFALQPGDDLTLAEILRGPFCDLVDDDRHLFALAHGREEQTLWQRLNTSQTSEFQAARHFCQRLIEHRDLPAFEFLTRALTERDAEGVSGWDKLIRRLGEPVRDPIQALLSGALSHDMSKAKSLQAYLSETEGRDTVLKRELGEPDQAVRVMTVHGAKGLQSPVVILPDTTGATKSVSDDLFFTDDGTPLHSPSSRLDCRATSELRDAANVAAERESRRLLYVALTRASDRLIIAGAGLGSSKTGYAKSSWYRWCLIAMRALTGSDVDDETIPGDRLFYGEAPTCIDADQAAGAESIATPAWLKRLAPAPAPPARLAAPSRLTEDRAAVIAPFGPDRSAALRRGRLIHALLQTLPDLPEADWERAGSRFLAREPDLSAEDQGEMLEVTLRTLRDPNFAGVFASGGRNEAAIVGTLPGGQMVNGRVDRLIIHEDHVMIVDYKTDRPAPVRASDIETPYLVQMAAYRAVFQTLFPDRPVRCALLYTDGPHLIELDGQAMSESLNRVESRV